MNKVYVYARGTALVLPRQESRGLPFYKSHGKSVPVAVMPSVIRKRYYAPEKRREEEEKEERKTRKGKEARAHAREKSFHRIVIEALRESHSGPVAFTSRGIIAHNFLPLCFGVVSHLRRPLSCPRPAPSPPPPPYLPATSDAAANLIQPRLSR